MKQIPVLAALAAVLIASCSQSNAPSDTIKDAANSVVRKANRAEEGGVSLGQGRYAPRDECKSAPGAEDFRSLLVAAVRERDADKLVALAAPDVKLDFGGGAGTAALRTHLAENEGLWSELAALMTLGCGVNEQGGITIPSYAAKPIAVADPGMAMIVTGEGVALRQAPSDEASELAAISWDVVELVGGLRAGAAFQQVKTADGTTGFLPTGNLRSLLDYRLIASSRDGKWSFTSLVKGD